jgi:hypothetical protein
MPTTQFDERYGGGIQCENISFYALMGIGANVCEPKVHVECREVDPMPRSRRKRKIRKKPWLRK